MTQAAILAASGSPGTTTGFKNKLINGNMVIDQRNAGASVSLTTAYGYTLDRWYFNISQNSKLTTQQNQGSVTPPTGFTKYLGITSVSAYTPGAAEAFEFTQNIEGYNIADLGWGTASAKTITISFWVRSSLTGTFGGCVQNDNNTRSYLFSYNISSANTWEQKSVTIAGETTGTWNTDNQGGLKLRFNLGNGTNFLNTAGAWYSADYRGVTGNVNLVGTNGATWQITGCQLEVGTTATNFDFRSITTELSLCQRYYEKSYSLEEKPGNTSGATGTNRLMVIYYVGNEYSQANQFKVSKRASPSISLWDYDGTASQWRGMPSVSARTTSGTSNGQNSFYVQANGTTADTALQGFWAADAEL